VVAFFWLVMISNPIHKLFVNATVNGPIERGPLWLAFAVVAYALILGSIGVLTWLATRRLNRDHVIQVRIMLAGGALPLISNFLYVTGWIDLGFDLTVAAFSFLAVLFVFGIYRHRMFALSPISLNRVIYDEPNALIITDREGRVCFANAAAENLFWASAELVSSPIFPVMDAVFELANQRGKPPGFKAICRPDDGKPSVSSGDLLRLRGTDRFFVFQKTELPTWRKRTFGFGVRLIEVTEIEYVKNRLAEHAGAMEAILDSVHEGILVVDGNGKMIFLNDRFQKMWDLPEHIMDTRIAEDAITHALDQLVDPDAFMAGMQALAASPQEGAERDQIHRKDGRVYERSTRPLLNGDEPVGRVCTFRDITTNPKSDPDLESSTA
jgi:PAS domain-containing protein